MDATAGGDGGFLSRSHLGDSGAGLAVLALRLQQPVDLEAVSVRVVGGGKQAAYMPGEKVVSAANEIFGFHCWSDEIKKMEVDYCVQDETKKWHVGIYCIMRVNYICNGRIASWREDIGYGTAAKQPSVDAAMELSRKSAVTDARKRALRLFGEALGGEISNPTVQTDLQTQKKNERMAAQRSAMEAAKGPQYRQQHNPYGLVAGTAAAPNAGHPVMLKPVSIAGGSGCVSGAGAGMGSAGVADAMPFVPPRPAIMPAGHPLAAAIYQATADDSGSPASR